MLISALIFKEKERGYLTPAHFFAAFSRPFGTSSD